MVFSEDMCSDHSQSADSQISIKEELDSETELSSNGPTSPCLPTPPPAHGQSHRNRTNSHHLRHSHDTRQQAVTSGQGLEVGVDSDTVILVSRDKRTGKREHILLRSLLKTRGSAAPGRVEKRVVVNRG